MSELLPCPFCGGKADVKVLEYDDGCKIWGVFCESDLANEYSHGHFVDNYATEAEAIAAWNTRAERTCKVEGDYWHDHGGDGSDTYEYVLSCGHSVEWLDDEEEPKYCPRCGARIEVQE